MLAFSLTIYNIVKGELILCTDIHVVDATIPMVVVGFGLSLSLYFSYYSLVMEPIEDAANNPKHISDVLFLSHIKHHSFHYFNK